MWSRRGFLEVAGTAFLAGLLPRQAAALANAELVFASACQFTDKSYGAVLVTERGETIATLNLPDRGHDVTVCPVTGRLVVFARRPGTFAIVFDRSGAVLETITSVEGRHFFGHGVFSPDGKLLYATENDYESTDGMIGIYDATDHFRRLGEFYSGGIEPHEALLISDRVLCVANGGIETHPDYGREKLNLATMAPNIAWIDRETGELLAVRELPPELHQVSLRHMAADPQGRVWVGAQYQGPIADEVPLLVRVGQDEDMFIPELSPQTLRDLRQYVGSVAASPDGQFVLATSPVGNTALILDTTNGTTEMRGFTNVCGAAFDADLPVLSTGDGQMRVGTGPDEDVPGILFDNHMLALA